MPTKEEFEAIIKGLGLDPAEPLDGYVKIGGFIYPKTASIELHWESEHREFKNDYEWYFEQYGDDIRARLDAWGCYYDANDFSEYTEFDKSDPYSTRMGIQVKISKYWFSLDGLMSFCDPVDIALADSMTVHLPMGEVTVSDLTFEVTWTVDKSKR